MLHNVKVVVQYEIMHSYILDYVWVFKQQADWYHPCTTNNWTLSGPIEVFYLDMILK